MYNSNIVSTKKSNYIRMMSQISYRYRVSHRELYRGILPSITIGIQSCCQHHSFKRTTPVYYYFFLGFHNDFKYVSCIISYIIFNCRLKNDIFTVWSIVALNQNEIEQNSLHVPTFSDLCQGHTEIKSEAHHQML